MTIRKFQLIDTDKVIALWQEAFSDAPLKQNPAEDIDCKWRTQRDLFWVYEEQGQIVGTIMAGYDGHRGWIYSVAVDDSCRGTGIGKRLVSHAVESLKGVGCRTVHLQVRERTAKVVSFYEKLGFSVLPRISMYKSLV
ncbi:MAG: GNAT family acetyltransferase [Pirellulaceae bacterium]|nr:GNAT family acetyltransferase [Pirellulaceae bacterium]